MKGRWRSSLRMSCPHICAKDLKLEKLRKKEGRFWVKFADPLPFPVVRLEALVSRVLAGREAKGEKCTGGWLFDCGTPEGKEAVLALDLWKSGDAVLRVASHSKGMSLEEMFKWVASQIEFLVSEEPYSFSRVHQLGSSGTMCGEALLVGVAKPPEGQKSSNTWRPPNFSSGFPQGKGKGKGKGGIGAAAFLVLGRVPSQVDRGGPWGKRLRSGPLVHTQTGEKARGAKGVCATHVGTKGSHASIHFRAALCGCPLVRRVLLAGIWESLLPMIFGVAPCRLLKRKMTISGGGQQPPQKVGTPAAVPSRE